MIWNPWHGCHKKSAGCRNCYMFRRDALYGLDSETVKKTASFRAAVQRKRDGSYKTESGESIYLCMTSDFFIEEADPWREEIWEMVRERRDLSFTIITKRIERFSVGLPSDWGAGWEHVTLCATCENQETAEERVPILLSLPLAHRRIIHEPMLEEIHTEKYLQTGKIERVVCGGESGENARLCDYEWILSMREQCRRTGTPFYFKQTGALFKKEGKIYRIERKHQQAQARKAGIDLGK